VKVLQRIRQCFYYSQYIFCWGFEETTGNAERTTKLFQYETEAYIGSKNTVAVVD
jgi:hypothetical protein